MNNSFITEERKIEITDEYDVLVAGGGIAGIAAALAAARNGAKTLIVERQYLLGGLATSGLITVYLPLCDGNGNQVCFGIVEELLRLSIKHGCENKYCPEWLESGSIEERKKKRFEVQFNASVYAILCEKLLIENGVKILYGTSICSAVTEDKRITAVITENKSGRQAYKAKSFVDATGDAHLCHLSGEKTINFQQGNLLCNWYYEHLDDEFHCRSIGSYDIPEKYKTEKKQDDRQRYTGVDAEEISNMIVQSHSDILEDFLKRGNITKKHALANIPTMPSIRMIRRIDGVYTMNDEEMFTEFEDSIGLISDWRKPGPVYEIPFRTLYGKNIKNVIVAGRCISVTDDMWDISRVIPPCAVTGQAAGTAAAMKIDFSKINVKELQTKLEIAGVKLHNR